MLITIKLIVAAVPVTNNLELRRKLPSLAIRTPKMTARYTMTPVFIFGKKKRERKEIKCERSRL